MKISKDSNKNKSFLLLNIIDLIKSTFNTASAPESENEPNRTEIKRFGSVRVKPNPNPNRLFKNSVEPNRTRTGKVRFDSLSVQHTLFA
jgi:hypothetical protein